ncbi:MAG: hypothetical protein O9324_19525 [Microcystis sp. LE19-84.1B]|uniref:hypothetical protein n=1 Tax=Microcystis sp. LE19-84.1B TaxID=3016438 RepID=UPI0022BEDBEA|nr:hypothetical protein [Microcystis sp. LE19-84.1B]MCZ8226079.1 hypothetical protein [Microcystis sp. LE19-84.1B]
MDFNILLSVISYQLSVISYQLSVISYQFTDYCLLITENRLNCAVLSFFTRGWLLNDKLGIELHLLRI